MHWWVTFVRLPFWGAMGPLLLASKIADLSWNTMSARQLWCAVVQQRSLKLRSAFQGCAAWIRVQYLVMIV